MEMKVTMATVNNPQEWSLNRLKRTSAPTRRPSCPGAKSANSAVTPVTEAAACALSKQTKCAIEADITMPVLADYYLCVR